MQKGVTKALVNTALVMPADFTRNADLRFPLGSMEKEIKDAVSPGDAEFLDATKLATGLMGDSIATNLFMVGYAYPARTAAAVEGRRSCARSSSMAPRSNRTRKASTGDASPRSTASACVAAAIPGREARFAAAVDLARRDDRASRGIPHRATRTRLTPSATSTSLTKVLAAESAQVPGMTTLTEAVARYYFKLLAIKDEYEVARLYTDGEFMKRVSAQFEGDYKLTFHLAPPLTNAADAQTGEAKKSAYGPWMMNAFRVRRENEGAARHARSTFSARPPSGGWSASSSPTTKR